MADFLNRLAARALGAAPLAEPVIPTRFSSGPEQSAFLTSEPAFQPTRPFPETSTEVFEERPRLLRTREADPDFETSIDRAAPPFQFPDEATPIPQSQRSRGFSQQAPPPSFAERDTVQPSFERAEVREQPLVAATEPSSYAVETPAAHKAQAISSTPAPFAEPQPAPRLTPLAEPMRSPALQRPELPQALRPAPPAVHVSIGRIEVRAEIMSPAPPRVQRPRPATLSLDQFLKQAGRGTR